jgi:branched-chain amino acid transport system substrate-binding protein
MQHCNSRWLCSLVALVAIGSCCVVVGAEASVATPPDGKAPFFDRRTLPLEYAGPGRETPEPENLAEVRIGYFGPDDPAHPEAGDLWCAAVLAIEQANREGGYQGKPFRLVARWSDNPWTGGAAHVTQMVYADGVWAIVGGIDSASTHLAEQVTTKARLPLVCAASSDRTANSAIVPWMFSLVPGNQLQAPGLVAELARRVGRKPFVVIAGEDHDARSFLGELNRSLAKHGLAPQFQFVYRPADGNHAALARRALDSQPSAVVLVADAGGSARLVRELRGTGFQGEIFGGSTMGRRRFLVDAGPAAEGVILPLLVEPGEQLPVLEAKFQARFQRSPDFAAAGTYDAVQLLVAAVRKAGLNRARIGDALRQLSPWNGAAGLVRWDTLGGNTRPMHLGTVSGGRLARLEARPTSSP